MNDVEKDLRLDKMNTEYLRLLNLAIIKVNIIIAIVVLKLLLFYFK